MRSDLTCPIVGPDGVLVVGFDVMGVANDARVEVVGTALRALTRRRAEHGASLQEGEPGPATAAVLKRQQRALELALGSVESRLAALERYAAVLAAADAADRDMECALRVSSRNDSYLDLVARTAADTLAVTELPGRDRAGNATGEGLPREP